MIGCGLYWITIILCLVLLSSAVNAVINQEAQRREAPVQQSYGPPAQPVQQQYGPPVNQRRLQAMQRLIAAMRAQQAGGYASQGRVVNRPRPIPLQKPQTYGPPPTVQNTYGPPQIAAQGHASNSHSAGSLHAFAHNHNPGFSCEGWIPIPGPSIGTANSASGAASISSSVDTSYGPPPPTSSHGSQSTLIVVPEENFAPPPVQNSYGPPHISSSGHSSSSGSIDTSYGVPPPPVNPQNSYGLPVSGSGHSSSSSIASIDTSYGIPSPPPQQVHNEYGVPNHGSPDIPPAPIPVIIGSGHASNAAAIEQTYGVPQQQINPPVQIEYGPPPQPINPPNIEYGQPPQIITHESAHNSAGGSFSIEQTYGPPVQPLPQPSPAPEYGLPVQNIASGHSSSSASIEHNYAGPEPVGHQTYGVPQNPSDFGPPESSYGPPPSGAVHHEDVRHGHAADIHTIQNELQLPEINSNVHFNNDIGIGASALGVNAGNSEVVKAQTVHESHTSEVTHTNANTADTYSAPPLDSYAPGKYAPSFLTRRPPVPTQPARRPVPRPQYIPPVPQKLHRPQAPPPNFRPIPQGGHAHSVAQSYASHSQSVHSQAPIRAQQPRQPLVYRPPVPQGLLQSIGQHVQAQDHGHRGHTQTNTYLPPPASELPIPPMKLVVPNSGPVQPFQIQSHSHQSSSGVATSSSSFQLQNHNLGNVQIIHDCGKGPQVPYTPHQTYGVPQNFGESHSAVLSAGYTVPAQSLEIPQHNSANFQQISNSYGPPASGPASLDVIGLDPRSNHHSELQTSETQNVASASLPGLSGGLSGLDFISAHKSHTLVLPKNQGNTQEFKFHIQGSHADVDENRLDGTNHQEILAEGLLQSILTAIEQKPAPETVPQVSEEAETEHKDAQFFLKSKEGQEVLADKSDKAVSTH